MASVFQEDPYKASSLAKGDRETPWIVTLASEDDYKGEEPLFQCLGMWY